MSRRSSQSGMKRTRDEHAPLSSEPDRKRRRDAEYEETRQARRSRGIAAKDSIWNDTSTGGGSQRKAYDLYRAEQYKANRVDEDSDHEIDRVYARDHDSEGHFRYVLGESVGSVLDPREPDRRRYKLLARIGQGTFGRVFSCWDRLEHRYVALKIVRAIKKYSHSAMIEIEILQRIKKESDALKRQQNPNAEPIHYCVELLSWFKHSNHVCMVFESYGPSIYDFMRENEYRPYHMTTIRDVARDTLKTLYFLHNVVGLVHTDLKPENILFEEQGSVPAEPPSPRGVARAKSRERSRDSSSREKDGSQPSSHRDPVASLQSSFDSRKSKKPYVVPKSNKIRVIDLGSAVYHDDHHGSIICTRNYRPPEVVLRLGWSSPADIWSLGCILLEMYTGTTLFQTHHNIEHLAMMEKSLGPIPDDMITNPPRDRTGSPAAKGQASPFSGFRNSAVAKYYEEADGRTRNDRPASSSTPNTPSKVKLMFPTPQSSRAAVAQVNIIDAVVDIVQADHHPEFLDLIKKMLIHDPAKRITADEALKHPFFATAD